MRKNENVMNIEGKVYELNLEEKVTGENSKVPNTPYIRGSINVAVDSTQENIIPVYYTYVAPTYSSGKPNNTYTALKKLISSGKTVITDGYEAASVVRLQPSYAMNDFFPNGQETPVSQPRNEGGFVTITNEKNIHPEGDGGRNRFSFDIVISGVSEVVPEEGDSYVTVKGVVFNFQNMALPIELVARHKDAATYFLGLGASSDTPVYTKVWGKIVNNYVTTTKTTESAFGEATVDTVTRRTREYLITGANPVPYAFDTDATITSAELKKALADREVHLAEVRKNAEEHNASRANTNASPAAQTATASVPQGGFKF